MRNLFAALIVSSGIAVSAVALPAVAAESGDNSVKGIFLVTEFPSFSARAGEISTVKIKLQNFSAPPEQLTLQVKGVPQGWKASILGGGRPVGAVMAAPNGSVDLQLRIDLPADAAAGAHNLVLSAQGKGVNADLPLTVTLGDNLPTNLALKAQLPSLRGTPRSSFDYTVEVRNDSGKDLTIRLAADAPPGFQSSFTENYGSQQITSLPIAAGQSKDVKVKVEPPRDIAAGEYKVAVQAMAEDARASVPLSMEVTGQPQLKLSGKDGVLSGEANAGATTPFTLVLTNEGSAPATDVEFSATPPNEWKLAFEPKKIAAIAPGQTQEVQVALTPSGKAIAGDYMATMRASGGGASSSADFRVTVTTSTAWGLAGIGLVVAALLVVVGAVFRFGRR